MAIMAKHRQWTLSALLFTTAIVLLQITSSVSAEDVDSSNRKGKSKHLFCNFPTRDDIDLREGPSIKDVPSNSGVFKVGLYDGFHRLKCDGTLISGTPSVGRPKIP